MMPVEALSSAVPATPARYTGPERRPFGAARSDPPMPGDTALHAVPSALAAASLHGDRSRVLDEVQEAVCAALCGDAPLFDLIRHRVVLHCGLHPLLSDAAAGEIERLLAVDIVQRHFLAFVQRRRLQRDLAALAETLRGARRGA